MSIQARGVVGALILIHVIAMLAGNASGYAATFISPGGHLLAGLPQQPLLPSPSRVPSGGEGEGGESVCCPH